MLQQQKISYPNKETGDKRFAIEAQELKDVINANADSSLSKVDGTIVVPSMEGLGSLSDGIKLSQKVITVGYRDTSRLGGGLFEAVDIINRRKLSFNGTTQGIDGPAMPDITTSELIIFKFKLSALSGVKTFFSTGGSNDIRVAFNISPIGDYKFHGTGKSTLNYIKELYGDAVNNNAMSFDRWYEMGVNPVADSNITSFNLAKSFGTFTAMEVESFSIASEIFEVNEGVSSIVTGSLETVADLIGTPLWGDLDVANGFDIVQSNNVTYKKQIENNTVSSFDYGAIDTGTVLDYTQDSSEAINSAWNSRYNVVEPPCKLYAKLPLSVGSPINIKLAGIYKPQDDAQDVGVDNIFTNTVIYTDQNINVLTLKAHNIKLDGGLFHTAGVSGYTKSVIRWDGNYKFWTSNANTSCYGNESELLTTGIGGNAFHADTSNITQSGGYFEDITISGYAYHYAKNVYIPPFDSAAKANGSFHNNWTLDVQGTGCKTYYWVESSLVRINKIQQDKPILNETEKEFPGIYLRGSDHTIPEAFIFDSNNLGSDPAGTYRHGLNTYDIVVNNISFKGAIERQYINGSIHTNHLMLNQKTSLDNPFKHYLSNYSGFISRHDSAILTSGDTGNVTYRGSKMPNLEWSDLNPYPFDDAVNNDVPLAVDANVTINNASRLLTSSPLGNIFVQHSIPDIAESELYFAEIVINDINNIQNIGDSKITDIYLTIDPNLVSIAFAIHFDTGILSETFPAVEVTNSVGFNSYHLLSNTGAFKDSKIRKIVIRLIGTTNFSNTNINDIGLKLLQPKNLPYHLNSGDSPHYDGDIIFPVDTDGPVVTDRITATKYRFFVSNGVIGIESI